MQFDNASFFYLILLLAYLLWAFFSNKKFKKQNYPQVIEMLEKSLRLLQKKRLEGVDNQTELDAFIRDYQNSLNSLKAGEQSKLDVFYLVFMANGDWTYITQSQHEELRAEVYECIKAQQTSGIGI